MSLLTGSVFSGLTDGIFIPVAIAGFAIIVILTMIANRLPKRRRRKSTRKNTDENLGFFKNTQEMMDEQIRKDAIRRKYEQQTPAEIQDVLDKLRKEPQQPSVETEFNYAPKPVMTETERKLFRTLAEITMDDFLILTQVDLKSVIQESGNVQNKTAFYKIAQKSVDFLLCSSNGETIAAIELQDWTHNRADRQKSDRDKAAALKSAGIPLIEFHAEHLPTTQEAAEALLPAISRWRDRQQGSST